MYEEPKIEIMKIFSESIMKFETDYFMDMSGNPNPDDGEMDWD
jgi:hypothetical protein